MKVSQRNKDWNTETSSQQIGIHGFAESLAGNGCLCPRRPEINTVRW